MLGVFQHPSSCIVFQGGVPWARHSDPKKSLRSCVIKIKLSLRWTSRVELDLSLPKVVYNERTVAGLTVSIQTGLGGVRQGGDERLGGPRSQLDHDR